MRKTHVTIALSLLLILGALLFQRFTTTEGFQGAATLPTGTQTVTDFVIYSDMNTIMDKLPFLHTNFTDVNFYDTAGLTSPLTMVPSGSPASTIRMRDLIASDSVPKLISFKLKSSITGPIDATAVEALNNASTNLFGGPGKIAFKTMNGNLYPSIVLPASAGGTGGSTGGTGGAGGATGGSGSGSTGGSTGTGGSTAPLASGYYKVGATGRILYLVKTNPVTNASAVYTVPSTVNDSACSKPTGTVKTLAQATETTATALGISPTSTIPDAGCPDV